MLLKSLGDQRAQVHRNDRLKDQLSVFAPYVMFCCDTLVNGADLLDGPGTENADKFDATAAVHLWESFCATFDKEQEAAFIDEWKVSTIVPRRHSTPCPQDSPLQPSSFPLSLYSIKNLQMMGVQQHKQAVTFFR